MKSFDMDADTKQMLQEISATMGVKSEIVREVWEFTIFTILLKVAENPDKAQHINIPYFGHILLRNNGMVKDENGNETLDLNPLVAVSDNFKNLYTRAIKEQYNLLSEYLEDKYIKPVLDELD